RDQKGIAVGWCNRENIPAGRDREKLRTKRRQRHLSADGCEIFSGEPGTSQKCPQCGFASVATKGFHLGPRPNRGIGRERGGRSSGRRSLDARRNFGRTTASG